VPHLPCAGVFTLTLTPCACALWVGIGIGVGVKIESETEKRVVWLVGVKFHRNPAQTTTHTSAREYLCMPSWGNRSLCGFLDEVFGARQYAVSRT
jgi:hypothetical protein